MQKGFFASLFDISFSSLITTRMIKVLYVIALVLIGLGAIFFIISAFNQSAVFGAFVLLIVAPLGALLYAIYTRVMLEVIIAVFRIMELNQEQVELLRGQASPPPTVQ